MTTAAREAEEIFQGEDILFPSTRAAISCILKFIFKFCFFLFLAPEILFSFEAIIQNLENVKNICLVRDYKAFPAFNLKD